MQKSLFRNTNYYLLMGYQLSNGIADVLFKFCIPWLVYDITGSSVQMTVTFGIGMLPHLLFSFLGGAIIDCFSRRKILLITSFLSCFTLLIFYVLFLQQSLNLELNTLYFIAFLLSSYNVFDQPAFDSSIVEYFQKNELVAINSTMEVVLSFCNVIGPLISAFLIQWVGIKHTILFIACFYIISFFLIKLSQPTQKSVSNKRFNGIGELIFDNCQLIKEGFIYLSRLDCPLFLIIGVTFLSNVFFGPHDTLIVFLARDKFNLNVENFAVALSVISLISAVGIALLSKDLKKFHIFTIITVILIIEALASIGMGLSNMIFLFGFYLITIIMSPIYSIYARSFRQSIVPNELAGRVASITKSFRYAGLGLGAIFSSIILEFISVESFFIITGCMMLFIAVMAYHFQAKPFWIKTDH